MDHRFRGPAEIAADHGVLDKAPRPGRKPSTRAEITTDAYLAADADPF
jgi:hypothetical protein